MTQPTLRKPWQPPVVRRIRAGEAENGFNPVTQDSAQFTTS
jgi:hypothetical protein